jgi:hypothetical protein
LTDKEELIALLTKWGVPFTEECGGYSGSWGEGIHSGIRVYAGKVRVRAKNWGYHGFYTEFDFDEDGSFTAMGAWE